MPGQDETMIQFSSRLGAVEAKVGAIEDVWNDISKMRHSIANIEQAIAGNKEIPSRVRALEETGMVKLGDRITNVEGEQRDQKTALKTHKWWVGIVVAALAFIWPMVKSRMGWAIAIIFVFIPVLCAIAAPPDGEPGPNAQWFNGLRAPDTGAGCCSEADCRVVEDRRTEDGYEVWIDRRWMPVPNHKILHKSNNPTGGAVACYLPSLGILCFVPGVGI